MTKEQEPVAWLACSDEFQMVSLFREHAEAGAAENEAVVVPLYRAPTFTDEEREAIKSAADFCESTGAPLPSSDQLFAIRDLLERTK